LSILSRSWLANDDRPLFPTGKSSRDEITGIDQKGLRSGGKVGTVLTRLHHLPPGHHFWIIRGALRKIGEDMFEYMVDKRVGKREFIVRADSMVPGEFHG
jgi:hypothetical protein